MPVYLFYFICQKLNPLVSANLLWWPVYRLSVLYIIYCHKYHVILVCIIFREDAVWLLGSTVKLKIEDSGEETVLLESSEVVSDGLLLQDDTTLLLLNQDVSLLPYTQELSDTDVKPSLVSAT